MIYYIHTPLSLSPLVDQTVIFDRILITELLIEYESNLFLIEYLTELLIAGREGFICNFTGVHFSLSYGYLLSSPVDIMSINNGSVCASPSRDRGVGSEVSN